MLGQAALKEAQGYLGLASQQLGEASTCSRSLASAIRDEVTRDIPLQIKRRGVEMRLVVESDRPALVKADPTLVKEIARGHRCFNALLTGQGAPRRPGIDRCARRARRGG